MQVAHFFSQKAKKNVEILMSLKIIAVYNRVIGLLCLQRVFNKYDVTVITFECVLLSLECMLRGKELEKELELERKIVLAGKK